MYSLSVIESFDCVSSCSNINACVNRARWYETAGVLLHQGKIDGTPGLPGSSGAIRLKLCQHRTHVSDFNWANNENMCFLFHSLTTTSQDDSGTAPGTVGIPGPAEDSVSWSTTIYNSANRTIVNIWALARHKHSVPEGEKVKCFLASINGGSDGTYI